MRLVKLTIRERVTFTAVRAFLAAMLLTLLALFILFLKFTFLSAFFLALFRHLDNLGDISVNR